MKKAGWILLLPLPACALCVMLSWLSKWDLECAWSSHSAFEIWKCLSFIDSGNGLFTSVIPGRTSLLPFSGDSIKYISIDWVWRLRSLFLHLSIYFYRVQMPSVDEQVHIPCHSHWINEYELPCEHVDVEIYCSRPHSNPTNQNSTKSRSLI